MSDFDPLEHFDPRVAAWFREEVGAPSSVQRAAWPVIAAGKHCLITAPTGSGKTLTAFLWALDRLITGAWETGRTRVLYVSPLKALNSDIARNLTGPLAALHERFEAAGETFPRIHVQTRSGDTPQSERQAIVRRPPEILVTTPESLNLLLSSPRARDILRGVQTVILDEIHAIAGDKRGTHLITAVERLTALSGEFQRIALSATVCPLETVAAFVGGYRFDEAGELTPRPVEIIRADGQKSIELNVRYPHAGLYDPEGGSRWPELAGTVKKVIGEHRSTLVFTNTRRVCERFTLHLNEGEPELLAYSHHGSLSKEMRTLVEQRLKRGELQAIVATSSLELGIDVGALDRVVLVQTPSSVSSTLQRLGRAGHQVGAVSRGDLYPVFGRDIVEAAAMSFAVNDRDLEEVRPVRAPLDVLAQVLLSMVSVDVWDVDELFGAVRTSWPYYELSRRAFDTVIAMLDGRYAATRIRALKPLVRIDRERNTITGKKAGLQLIYRSGGTIPDRGYFNLRRKDSGAKLGELDEEFVWERFLGDTFTFGTQTWQINQITHNDVLVTPGNPNKAGMPFWKAERTGRGFHFSERVGEFLETAERDLDKPSFQARLENEAQLEPAAVQALVEFLHRQRDHTGAPLPHRRHVLLEHCTDHRRGKEHPQLILHAPWGASVTRPFALALSQRFEDELGEPVSVWSNDDAIVVPLPPEISIPDVLTWIAPEEIEDLLRRRLERSGFFGARFRENAGRALLLPRDSFGKRMPLWMTRVRAKKLLESVADFEDFPILIETWRTCLQDFFEIDVLRQLLQEIRRGEIASTSVETTYPSPFCDNIVWNQTNEYMYAGDEAKGALRSRMSDDWLREVLHSEELRPSISETLVSDLQSKLQRVAPGYAPRPGDDLRDWVRERLFIPWMEWEKLCIAIQRDHGEDASADGLIEFVIDSDEIRGVTTGEQAARMFHLFALTPEDCALRYLGSGKSFRISGDFDAEEDSAENWLQEWLRFYGPVDVEFLRRNLPIGGASLTATNETDAGRFSSAHMGKMPMPQETRSFEVIDSLLDSLADVRSIISGELVEGSGGIQVCDAENFETLLRMTRRAARIEFEARPIMQLQPFLAARHGIGGAGDIESAMERLLVLPLSLGAFETFYLPARVPNYVPAQLDELILERGLHWVGCGRAAIAWLLPGMDELWETDDDSVDDAPSVLPAAIGRYTFSELLDHTGMTSADLTERLWSETWAGRVTCDDFDTVRKAAANRFRPAKTDTERRRPQRGGFSAWKRTRPFAGHWLAAPHASEAIDALDAIERDKERARIVLERYGIIFRELLQREQSGFRWGALFRALRLMELSGEIVSGQFFEGIQGLQFATSEAVESLADFVPGAETFWLHTTDPASICGLGLDDLRGRLPARHASAVAVWQGDRLVAEITRGGKALTRRDGFEDSALEGVLAAYEAFLAQGSKRVTLETVDGGPASESSVIDAFRERFEVSADPGGVTLWRRVSVPT